eukprot:TRINITY_DN55541_c0_g1_i2.p1 TRINITY_DN55541_c0_g1~~TRINITY_DN55541_c0_g1_i2.p1  ORF type:complete len:147 (-),score=20.56 TRINITY_DN55541_c0_g1_i2:96-536(-)
MQSSLNRTEPSSSNIFSSFSRRSSRDIRTMNQHYKMKDSDELSNNNVLQIRSVGDIGMTRSNSSTNMSSTCQKRLRRRRSSTMTECIVHAMSNYKADSSDCMNLRPGDAVYVLDRLDNERWWIGKKLRSESTGLFPVCCTTQNGIA